MEFLTAVTPSEALGMIKSFPLPERKRLSVRIDEALKRVVAEEIVASDDIPSFTRSLVDGFAVRVNDVLAHEIEEAFVHPVYPYG